MGETVERDGIVYAVKKTYDPKTGGIAKTLVPVGKVDAPADVQAADQPAKGDPDAKPKPKAAKTGKIAKAKSKVSRRKKK
jgi:hypothetical protein